jgi:hypothetical protein
MNDPSQHELDDELLSAYLDDELSAEERALVEARLASDPAAQQTIEQLRHVSQTVRSLPRESAPADLQGAVMRRVEAAKAASTGPAISIGKTRRGWIWASLAVAAALLIMVVQPDETNNREEPAVALKQRASAETSDRFAHAPAEWRTRRGVAENKPKAAAEVQDLAAASAPRAPASRDVSESLASSSPAPVASAPSASFGADATAAAAAGELADASKPETASTSNLRRSSSTASDFFAPAQQPADGDVVVVHVLAKPVAIRNKAFDKLLASNGVVVDPTDESEKSAERIDQLGRAGVSTSGRIYQQGQQIADEVSQVEEVEKAQRTEEIDVVLVEAPPTTIFSCMQDLNSDADNYLGVQVDALAENEIEAVAKAKTPAARKLATDLGIYNRGAVPLDTKTGSQRGEEYYDYAKNLSEATVPKTRFRSGGFGGGGVGGAAEAGRAYDKGVARESGRARRLAPQAATGRRELAFSDGKLRGVDGAAPSAGGAEPQVHRMVPRGRARELKELSGGADAPMQVLFVLRAGEESPPSAPSRDRAE